MTMIRTPREVLDFWLDEVGETGWYAPPEGLDDRIRDRFEDAWVADDFPATGHADRLKSLVTAPRA